MANKHYRLNNDFNKKGTSVEVKNNDVNRAWRKLKRLVQQENVLQDLREKQQYDKPSDRKRREKAMARKRWLKKEQEIKERYGI